MKDLQKKIDRLIKRNINLSIRQSRNSLIELRDTIVFFVEKNNQNNDDEENFKVDSDSQSAVKKNKSFKIFNSSVFLNINKPKWDD